MSDCAPVWKSIPGFPLYQAADDGRIRSLRSDPPRVLVQCMHKGYPHVQLKMRPGDARLKVPVHRLVLLAFAGPLPEPRMICRHLNGDRTDNRACNLRWGTHAENHADAVAHGTAVCANRGERHPASKLTDAQYVAVMPINKRKGIKGKYVEIPEELDRRFQAFVDGRGRSTPPTS